MKKILLIGLILFLTLSPCPPKNEKKEKRIYFNTSDYKYDDDQSINPNPRR
jgi:hypothetical protein